MVTEYKSEPRPTPGAETGNVNHMRCGAHTKSGQPCGGRPNASGSCFAHDPALSTARESARVRGGKNSSQQKRLEKLMPERLRPTFDLLEKAVTDVYEGRLAPQKASAMASLTSVMVKVIKAGENTSFSLAPQLEFPGVEEWYAMIRSYRRMTPRLRDDGTEGDTEATDSEMIEALERFGNKYGKIQLPKETI